MQPHFQLSTGGAEGPTDDPNRQRSQIIELGTEEGVQFVCKCKAMPIIGGTQDCVRQCRPCHHQRKY